MSSSEEIINNNKDTNDVNKNNNNNDINDINNNSISDNDNITLSTSNSTTATTLLSKNEEHNITVYTRIRPLSSLSKKALQNKHSEIITPIENNTSLIIKENINTSLSPKKHQQQQQKIYEFDKIFDQNCTQENLYTSKIKNIINDNVWSGYNVTIFAYGQSGSGKTYTMGTHDFSNDDNANTNANSSIRRKIRTKLIIGQEEKKDEQLQEDEIEHEHEHQSILNKDDGIIPRVAYDLFHNNNDNKNISIQMSYLEVYNEEIRDLLSSSPTNNSKSPIKQHQQNELRIRDDGTVTNLTILNVKNTFHVKNIMKEACKKRVTALTSINNVSSRSHAICTFYIKVVDDISNKNDTTICSSKLSLVDLAGSERVKRTNAIGDRFSEGVHINKGLLVLGQVISTLSEQSQSQQSKKNNRISNSHIPYRDSKLTRLLQDSLGGNSRTIMIACVSSCKHDIKESVNTLRYAQRARNIKNSTSVGKYSTSNSSSNNAHVIAIQRENENLKMKIQRLNRQMNIKNTMNSSYNNKPIASSSSLQQHLNNSGTNASKITKKENIITKKENTLLQKQNDSLHKEILEIKKRNVNLQKKIREESSKRNNEVKEYKLKSTKLLRENQKLKVDVSKMSSKVNNQSLILRRRASDTINKNKINNKNNSSGSSRRLLQNNASANSSSNNRRVSNAYNRNNSTNNIDVFSSRQEMVNTFERDIELATLILDTKDEIDLLEKAISKEKKLKQQQQSSLSSSLAKAVSSSTLNSSITNDTTAATTITNAQNEIELRSNTIESLQKRILDLSSKNTIITNNNKNKNNNNNNSNTKKDVVLLTMAKQLSYAELKYVLSYSFDIHVHTKRNIQNIINSEVTTKLKSERELMIKEKINLHNKYEKDILEFMEHGLGIDNGVKLIVDDMLGSHDFYKYCSGGSSTSSVREDRSNDNNNDNDG